MGGARHPFIQGLELCALFYEEGVGPILGAHFPGVVYSAARLGPGSDVLGFDTPQSMDHDWGPRLTLFLDEVDHERYRDEINRVLRAKLPREIRGYSTGFGRHEDGTIVMQEDADGPVNHHIDINTVRAFFEQYLNWNPGEEPGLVDWLTFPAQHLRSLVAGRVFHDGLGRLEPARASLRYYPRDVWLYLLAAQWGRISQEEAFVGRCGQVGDELGSRLVAGRLARDLMRLCFLMERQYAPYIKWFGTAFTQLDCAPHLTPILTRVLEAGSWQEREKQLSAAYEFAAGMHNDLGVTDPLPTQVSRFHDRPFYVIHAENFSAAIRETIASKEVRALPPQLGAIDQFVDSTDVLSYPEQFGRLKLMYR